MRPTSPDLTPRALDAFLAATIEEPGFAAEVAGATTPSSGEAPELLGDLASEARRALGLIAPLAPSRDSRVLEVGAGAGVFATFLHAQGLHVTAIEPESEAFDHISAVRSVLADHTEVPDIARIAADALDPAVHGTYDLIFSVNVLEHMLPMRSNLDAIGAVLAPGGSMVHTCPNYRIPYEPHYGIPLVPGRPALTAHLARRTRTEPGWQTLNWITAGDIKAFARRHGLDVRFHEGELAAALARLRGDEAFERRQRGPVVATLRFLERVGATRVLQRLPGTWMTPMTFTATRATA